MEQFKYMLQYLSTVDIVLAKHALDSAFEIPTFDRIQCDYIPILRSIVRKSRSGSLEKLIEFSGIEGKVIIAKSNKAFIRFSVVVPDEVDRIVILDASAEINLLNQYDPSVQIGDIGDIGDIQKDYRDIVLHYAPVKSSRDYLSSEFNMEPEFNLYLKELGYIVLNHIPMGDEFFVLTYKDRDGIRYGEDILEYLDQLGLGFKDRCHVITWGNERGTNRYSHVKYAITMGVVYRDPSEIAASIIGQSRDLDYRVNNKEIKEVSDSLQADILYQGFSRGNMRHTNRGIAGDMTCWVLHKERRVIEMLEDAMPNVTINPYTPVYLSEHGVSDAVADQSRKIIDYLDSVPSGVEKVSNQQIAKAIGCTNTNSRTWRNSVSKASNDQFDWEKPNEAQSFYRGSELIKYRETHTFSALTDKTLLH